MYTELEPTLIVETIARLESRIAGRFPGSGLARVVGELRGLASEAGAAVARLRRPIWPLRIGAAIGILGLVGVTVATIRFLVAGARTESSLSETLQGSEAVLNVVILLAAAIYFMVSLEIRAKRRGALKALHRLRSIVHIVDMHQLTKDPMATGVEPSSASDPIALEPIDLARYLDFCSELFSLTSKLAALYVQYLNDPVVLEAVNDIESLAAGLSSKVWQKIVVLDDLRRVHA